MEKHEKILLTLIGITATTAVWYLIISFITMNLLWFIDSVIGRAVATILIILTLYVNIKTVNE